MDPLYRPERRRGALAADLGGRGPLPAPSAGARRDETYVICVPPPNVTGRRCTWATRSTARSRTRSIRWHRMRGFNTLWQPGYDHAGDRDPGRGREGARARGDDRGRSSAARRSSSASGSGSHEYGGDDHGPVPAPRRLARLLARALHDGRRLRPRRDAASSSTSTSAAGSTATTGSSTGARSARHAISDLEVEHVDDRRHAHLRPLPVRRRRRLRSRSRPCARRRSSPTSPSPCIPDDERYRDAIGKRGDRARSSGGACR